MAISYHEMAAWMGRAVVKRDMHFYWIPLMFAIMSAYATYLLTDPTVTYAIYGGDIKPMTVKVGDAIGVQWYVKRVGPDCPVQIQHEFSNERNSVHIKYDSSQQMASQLFTDFRLVPGSNRGVVNTPTQVVPTLPPGRSRYRAQVSYECNWLRKALDQPVVIVTPYVEFEVVK